MARRTIQLRYWRICRHPWLEILRGRQLREALRWQLNDLSGDSRVAQRRREHARRKRRR